MLQGGKLEMFNLALRNVKNFFRQKSAVIFSLLSVLIIIALFALFLGQNLTDSIQNEAQIENAKIIMNSWVMAGIVAVTCVTAPLGALAIMISDKNKKIIKDLKAAPIKTSAIAAGYFLNCLLIGFIMSSIALIVGEVYLVIIGAPVLTFVQILKILGIMVISLLASGSFAFFIASLIQNDSAYAAVNTIIGTLIGFLMGIYVPIGVFGKGVQWAIMGFPLSHSAVLLRQVFTDIPIKDVVSESFSGQLKNEIGVTYDFGNGIFPVWGHILILLLTAVLFFGLSVLVLSKKKK